ncbi:unnamed protein product [Lupinus luteus]|uniref:Hexosyltransferase n=1 Tax=Lupinus luteus TaxID=3873 RepID=A0AAV1VZR8_LUPLU
MLWIMKFSMFFSFAMFMIILSPSLQSFHPAEAIRSSPLLTKTNRFTFRKSSPFRNSDQCNSTSISGEQNSTLCDPFLVHIAITLDFEYLRGSIAAVNSILQRSLCPNSVFFHFIISNAKNQNLESLVESTFPELKFKVYSFNPEIVKNLISTSLRQALEQPLNYARNYLAEILEDCVQRVIYLDSDLIVVDDISKLWSYNLDSRVIGVPEYCHANFSNYFTTSFWSNSTFAGTFKGRRPCYFNTGVMVLDLFKWRKENYTKRIEKWMEIQKSDRIYELGSLPPFLLVFAGQVAPIEHRWNQHGLGGDNVRGNCRDLHPGPVSLLHWSGSGKPWLRLDSNRPCPLDLLWAQYDLYGHSYS